MDHIICINKNSFPAESAAIGARFFDDALQGVLELQSGSDRFLFYLDTNSGDLLDFEISDNFTYEQFCEECNDLDLALFLSEVEDKSPALDSLTEEQLEEMAADNFYVPDEAMDIYPDVYALAWAVSGYLLSAATKIRWNQSHIAIARADAQGRYVNEPLILRNISTQSHGIEHYEALHGVDLEEIAAPHVISQPLLSWFNEQTPENKARIVDKVRLSCDRNFQGAKPLFDTLSDGGGLREIRIPAYSGGAIRILFKHLKQQQALLIGFIKHSNSEGYTQAMKQAHQIYSELPTQH